MLNGVSLPVGVVLDSGDRVAIEANLRIRKLKLGRLRRLGRIM